MISYSFTLDVKDIIVWGNISGSFYIDLQRAKVFNYNGPIQGPSFFFQSVLSIFYDRFVTGTKSLIKLKGFHNEKHLII